MAIIKSLSAYAKLASPSFTTPTLGVASATSLIASSTVKGDYSHFPNGVYVGGTIGGGIGSATTSIGNTVGEIYTLANGFLNFNFDLYLRRDAANTFAQRNSTNAQTYRLYETYTDASNYSRLSISAPAGGPITFASEAAGTGTAKPIDFYVGGIKVAEATASYFFAPAKLYVGAEAIFRNSVSDDANAALLITGGTAGITAFGGRSASFPAFKRSSAVLQGRLADDSAFCQVQGKLTTDVNATTGLTAGVLAATTNATITITDASGQVYRVPCII